MRWIIFFAVFAVVYGGPHYYLFRKAKQFLPWPGAVAAAGLFLALMVAGPFLTRWLEHGGYETGARAFAFAVFTWMGFALIFFACLGAVKLGLLAFPQVRSGAGFLLALAAAAVLTGVGYQAAFAPRIERVRIASPRWTDASRPLRIAQISDIHVGMIVRKARLEKLLAPLADLQPDVIVSTGDLVDAQINHCQDSLPVLAALQAPLGKFAVNGNHEFYSGLDQAQEFTRAAGFRLLRGEAVQAGPGLWIAGVDDPAARRMGRAAFTQAPGSENATGFRLLLKHRPEPEKNPAAYDLQLSGHVHAGQIFPFSLLTRLAHRYHAGLYELARDSWIYVSRGTGTWGPPLRLLAAPEITLIEITAATGVGQP